MGDYGPDASTGNANRGPQGSVEYNVIPSAGNYGWPYCIRDNTPYNDYNFATSTSGAKFDCAAPKNDSPNNTGVTDLPAARGASAWMGFSETDPRHTGLGTGGAPMGGPRYHYDPNLVSDRKFPAFYDDKWFIAEWNNGWIKTTDLSSTGTMSNISPFALGTGYKRPMDLDFGPDGALYVIEWGSGFNGNNADSGVYRIEYTAGDKAPDRRGRRLGHERSRAAGGQLQLRGLRRPRGRPGHLRLGLHVRRHDRLHRRQPVVHLHDQRRLHGQAHGHRPDRPDRREQRADLGGQPRADGQRSTSRPTARSRPSRTRSRTRSRSPIRRTARPAPASTAPTSRSRSRSATTSTRMTSRARRAAKASCRPASPPATARRPTRSRSSPWRTPTRAARAASCR